MSDRTKDRGPNPRTTDTSPSAESALDPSGTQAELQRGAQGHLGAAVDDREGARAAARVESEQERGRAVRGEREDAPELEPARLGDLDGVGLLTVVRDATGGFVEANGTWRERKTRLGLEELQARLPAGSSATYEGPMVQRQVDAPSEQVRLTVVVTRHGEYEDYEGNALRLVNFVAHEVD